MNTLSDDYLNRFGGIGRLYGTQGLEKLAASHVAVIGIGGVGSWIAEAVARCGVGEITLMDFDDVCTSNFNRQIHSLESTVGKFKVDVMGERILGINKSCRLHKVNDRFTEQTAEQFLSKPYDYIIDAFDNTGGKSYLINYCRKNKKKLIVLGSVGGKTDPTKIKIDDLSRSSEDSLLSSIRKKLRTDYKFPRGKEKFGIPCVFSTEKYMYFNEGCMTKDRPKDLLKPLDCQAGMGAVTHLAGSFAFFAVSKVVRDLVGEI